MTMPDPTAGTVLGEEALGKILFEARNAARVPPLGQGRTDCPVLAVRADGTMAHPRFCVECAADTGARVAIDRLSGLLAAAREAGRAEGDQAARRDIYEAIMQPGANGAARRSGFTGHEGAVWATGYVAGKLECSRLAIADDDEWSRLARARAQHDRPGDLPEEDE